MLVPVGVPTSLTGKNEGSGRLDLNQRPLAPQSISARSSTRSPFFALRYQFPFVRAPLASGAGNKWVLGASPTRRSRSFGDSSTEGREGDRQVGKEITDGPDARCGV